jgi:hypothetical protein
LLLTLEDVCYVEDLLMQQSLSGFEQLLHAEDQYGDSGHDGDGDQSCWLQHLNSFRREGALLSEYMRYVEDALAHLHADCPWQFCTGALGNAGRSLVEQAKARNPALL